MKARRLLVLCGILAASLAHAYDILYEGDSLYHHIRVTEETGYRYLSFDETRGTQSVMKVRDPIFLQYVYTRLAFAGLAFCGEPSDVLFLGLGGASMPKFFRNHYPKVNVDIVEIDAKVVEVAKKFFGFEEDDHMRVYVKDGRVFLTKTDKKYDLILLDAYNTRSIPFHLTTKEFLEEVRRHLKPDGVVVSNIWSPAMNRFFEAEIKTFQVTFPELYIFPALNSGNYIFVATNQPGCVPRRDVVARAARITRDKRFSFDLADLVKSTYQYATKRPCRASVLTDDRAPVNVLRWQPVEQDEESEGPPG